MKAVSREGPAVSRSPTISVAAISPNRSPIAMTAVNAMAAVSAMPTVIAVPAVVAMSVVAVATVKATSVVAASIKSVPIVAVIPGTRAYEDAVNKKARTIVSVRCASIRVVGIVAIGTDWRWAVIRISIIVVARIIVAVIGIPIVGIAIVRSVIVVVVVSVIVVITVVITTVRVPVIRVAVAIIPNAHASRSRDLCRCRPRHKGQNPQHSYVFQIRHDFSFIQPENELNRRLDLPGATHGRATPDSNPGVAV